MTKHLPTILAVPLVALLAAPQGLAADEDPYKAFSEFCVEHFGAEKEELTYTAFGKELKFVDGGAWVYCSERSACVVFQTTLPAKAYVEYGPTDKYGSKTDPAERNFYIHLRYLAGLEPGKEYHYRLVAEDERGKVIKSDDRTFKTALPEKADVIRIPGDLQGPPYVLNKSGAYYLVTKDMVIDGMAFDIPEKVTNVTLDLGGHTVVYNQKAWPKIESDNFWDWIRRAQYGLRAMTCTGLKVYNGTIAQGAGNNAAQANSIGYNPLYLNGCTGMEIAGVTLKYAGPQQVAIYNHWGGSDSRFHHNVFVDAGTEVPNRHGAGCKALLLYGDSGRNVKVDHNLVKRTRQSGLGGNEVFDNEIYVDSWATNSFGVGLSEGGKAYDNKVLGTGYHVVAFGWGKDQTFYRNFVHLEGTGKGGRFKEYGDQISLNGFRLTQYNGSRNDLSNQLYYENTVVVRAREECEGRGVQFFSDPYVKNLVFRDNTVKAVVADSKTKQLACIVTQGLPDRTEDHLPIIYQGGTFTSNICNIRFGDYYGTGSNHRFYGCKFVRTGDDPRYKTFLWDTGFPCKNHVVRDPVFEGGAGLDSIAFKGADQDLTVEWTVTVKTAPGAAVKIADKDGKEVFSGQADDKGAVEVPLGQYKASIEGRIVYTPHAVTAEKDAKKATVQVTADAKKTVELPIK